MQEKRPHKANLANKTQKKKTMYKIPNLLVNLSKQ
jgi:hypothetical protein